MEKYIIKCRTARSADEAFCTTHDYIFDHGYYGSGWDADIRFVPDELFPFIIEGFRGVVIDEQDLQSWLEEKAPPKSISVEWAKLGENLIEGYLDGIQYKKEATNDGDET